MGIDDTWFDRDSLVWNIDRKNAVHTGEADDNAVRRWERTPRESGAGSTSDKGDAMLSADADDCLYFVSRSRQHYGGG
jgi:hypothetical protein